MNDDLVKNSLETEFSAKVVLWCIVLCGSMLCGGLIGCAANARGDLQKLSNGKDNTKK